MKFYKRLNIRNKLLFMFILQMVLPVAVLSVFLLRNVENNMKSQALTLSQDMLKILELRITDFADDTKSVSQDLLYDLEVYDVLNDDQSDKLTFYNNVNNLKNVLRTLTLSNKDIQAVSIFDLKGDNYTYEISNGRLDLMNYLPYETLLALAREAEGRPVWHIDFEKSQGNIYLTRIINDIDTFNEVGLLIIQVNMAPMKHEYEGLQSEIFEEIYLLDSEKRLVFSSGDHDINTSSIKISESSGVFYEDGSKDRMISYRKMNNPDWYIVTAISKTNLLAEVNRFTSIAFLIFIPLAIVLSLFTIFEGLHMVASINTIVSGMEEVSQGKKHVNIHVDRGDEIGFLAESFNEMTTEIENLVENVYEEQLTRKEVELKALQSQINPHFLYNTLETINWHAQLKGAPEISHMVTALSSIMEATIGRDNKLISLRDELKYIENYISIMTYRYEGRLKFNKTVDTSLLNIKIPRLILQPIVENAINHGIGQSVSKSEINITAKKSEDHIYIEICDNGKGIAEAELKALIERINKNQENNSIGLENVNRRLKLFYGDNYGVRIYSEENVYTKVVLDIPEKRLNEGDMYYV